MSILNKICVFICCCQTACGASEVIDGWGSCEACLSCNLHCGGGCWSLCYPIWSQFEMGDTERCKEQCTIGCKQCILAIGLDCAASIDPIINCALYSKKIFTDGVTGFKDVTENASVIGNIIREKLELPANTAAEPYKTYSTYTP